MTKLLMTKKNMWICHHRLEIDLNKSHKELKLEHIYYGRPASELIFLTYKEHNYLHFYGKHYSLGKCGKRGKDKKKRKPGSGIRKKL